jgi:hypothetical protein
LDALRVQVTVDIDEAVIEESLHPGAFLGQEPGRPDILFGVLEIDGHMSSVEIPGNNDVLTTGMQPIAQSKQVSIKI